MTNTMNTTEIIALQKEIVSMGDKKTALLAAVAAAMAEVKTAGGYKVSIARAKLRDAETAVVEHDAAVAVLEKQFPPEEAKVWFSKHYAAYELKRDARLAVIASLEEKLTGAIDQTKTSAWKWAKGGPQKETSAVTAVRAQITAEHAAIALLDEENKLIKKMVGQYKIQDASDAEFAAWLADGPKPEYLRIRDEIEQEKFLEECVSLKLPRRGYTFNIPATPPAEVDEWEAPCEWVSTTIEEWAQSLMPPPPVEEIMVFKPSTRSKTPAWMTRFTAAMARKKAERTPMLVITEVA